MEENGEEKKDLWVVKMDTIPEVFAIVFAKAQVVFIKPVVQGFQLFFAEDLVPEVDVEAKCDDDYKLSVSND